MKIWITVFLSALILHLQGQTFTKITTGPVASDPPSQGYSGVSWIDVNGDGYVDLFMNPDYLYLNDSTGGFTKVTNSGITAWTTGLNHGNSWADVDNDGDVDLVLVNQNNNSNGLYLNDGTGIFSKADTGDIATHLNAWSPAWGDYDNDGWVDLIATHPCGFIGACHANWLFHNNQNGSFTEITDSEVNMGLAAYTVGNWADFDDDGDLDLFIGSGEVSVNSKDHIYINQLAETGTPDLVLTQAGTLFGDIRDGQNWNLVDYDNDGDLDAFVTNYKQDIPNDFYKNNGDGTFTRLTETDLGVHMVSETGVWLGNTWGDFNNDGWIDVVITADYGSPFGNHMYLNQGNGTFVHHFPSFTNLTGSRSVANGDYDNDGDLDLFINGNQATIRGLFRNELPAAADRNWLNISLEGTNSNRSAIGAKVRVKANIDTTAVWQRRDISAQNAFCGQNDLRVHVGLGKATVADSIVIEWPSGLVEYYTALAANQFVSYVEGPMTGIEKNHLREYPMTIYPNPANSQVILRAELDNRFHQTEVRVVSVTGQEMLKISKGTEIPGVFEESIDVSDWPSGMYFIILRTKKGRGHLQLLISR